MACFNYGSHIYRLLFIVAAILASESLADAGERIEKSSNGRICFTNLPSDESKGKASSIKKKSSVRKTAYSKQAKKISITSNQRMLYWDHIKGAGNKYEIDTDLIVAVIRVESNFKKKAKSRKGAMGLMQLMPETARILGVKNAYNPKDNIYAGTRYLRQLLNSFNDLRLSLAAYNAGPKAVEKFNGIPPYPETRAYVSLVMQLYKGFYTQPNRYFVRTSQKGKLIFTNISK